jgi:hypothetical protein
MLMLCVVCLVFCRLLLVHTRVHINADRDLWLCCSCCVSVACVVQVAVGARHAALLTRGGEVYTWGSGQGGQLGNGTSGGTGFPYQVRHSCNLHSTRIAACKPAS